ncbi:septum formation initiator family protein [Candidatus Peregrinibacteria bacterium]|nr:septum formation initiator family protein [Candidatus Peregrinibacteria bacterium]
MNPASSHSENPSYRIAKAVILIGFILVTYMLYALTVEMYQNYQIDRHITAFETKNETLKRENTEKIQDLQYFTSEAYIEKIAKQNLGLINYGEEVIVLPALDESIEQDGTSSRKTADSSNFAAWWKFFFVENDFR